MTKIACIGAGYFARFHVDAWTRLPDAELVAICDRDEAKARALAEEFGVAAIYTDVETMCRELDAVRSGGHPSHLRPRPKALHGPRKLPFSALAS